MSQDYLSGKFMRERFRAPPPPKPKPEPTPPPPEPKTEQDPPPSLNKDKKPSESKPVITQDKLDQLMARISAMEKRAAEELAIPVPKLSAPIENKEKDEIKEVQVKTEPPKPKKFGFRDDSLFD